MSYCKQIERYLWDLENLTQPRRVEIEAHLSECERCRSALKTITAVEENARMDRVFLSSISAEQFDSAVMRNVRSNKRLPVESAVESRRYMVRLAFSLAAAAAIVLFLVKSVSDLGPIQPPSEAINQPEQPKAKEYGLINLEMRSREKAESPAAKAEKKAAPPEEKVFSILPSPVTAPSPESINIGAIFVANDNIPLHKQSQAASLAEMYADTGSMQAALPQSSVLVTVEKMPLPVNMAMPEYPVWARKRGYSCTVWVKARVEIDGRVSEAQVMSSDMPGVGFEDAAVKAALKSHFLPASSNGKNFPVWVIYPVKFIYKQ